MAAIREVLVGDVRVGGGAPISIQSMTNTDTRDVEATVRQIELLTEAGCEIVRVSVYDTTCAKAIRAIKDRIRIPLVADIHFDHTLAILAAENGVDKLRINPGNIGGETRVRALADCAKAHQLPIRIGVNAGSLEREILKKYGKPTPAGMVESALSHIRLLENVSFYDIVLSLKASNVADTVQAYRLMQKETDYPLHIGVTEAGMGTFALIKSAAGLGALLLCGIGDTLRVSLTGDPVQEVYAARDILRAVGMRREGVEIISCPTCGRCHVPLSMFVQQMEQRLPREGKPITVALMGCAVNGPGEAREADIGIAFGKDNGVLFKKGEQIASGDIEKMMDLLVEEALAVV